MAYTETVLRYATKPDAEYLKSQATALEALKTFALGSGEGSIKVELVAEGAKAVVDAGLPEPELCPGWGVSTTGGAPTHTRLSAGGAGRFCPRTCW
ncbi:hypothetical protein ACFY0Z_30840 [Streptomyces kronopolitis]|uniref:hypothetical protein n=1 Tax=Streptomyces kronopolitis TaxID=1612435 RepID=UPI003695AC53